MARRSNRVRTRIEGGGRIWWWLALPLLCVAAYAAFDATLDLVMPEQPGRAVAPDTSEDVAVPVVAGAGLVTGEAPATGVDPLLGVPVAPEPVPTPSAAAARAAAAVGAAGAKPKRKAAAAKEDLTEQDRRALERLIERATAQEDPR